MELTFINPSLGGKLKNILPFYCLPKVFTVSFVSFRFAFFSVKILLGFTVNKTKIYPKPVAFIPN
ncbi:MAG: hypothetical protein EAY66_03190 [Sphingobacteriales bacterium]|jgi:hypothetical protein|nr:MAG: hypothetical protein EAY66_03190 [Sphingobacteriales bacterium]